MKAVRPRSLIVVGAECVPFMRRTGLAEFGCLLPLLARSGAVDRVLFVGPEYRAREGGPAARPEDNLPAGWVANPTPDRFCSGIGVRLVPCFQDAPWLNRFEWVQGFQQTTPADWSKFTDLVRAEVSAYAAQGPTKVLVLDWTGAGLVPGLKEEASTRVQVVMVVDLAPPADPALVSGWETAMDRADALVVPSEWWWKTLVHTQGDPARTERWGGKKWVIGFGYNSGEYDPRGWMRRYRNLEAAKAEAKLRFQRARRLEVNPRAFLATMQCRFSDADEKNHALLAQVAEDFLQLDSRVQLRISPMFSGKAAPKGRSAIQTFLSLVEKYPGRFSYSNVGFEARELGARLGWPLALLASDVHLAPSKSEPFGINPIQAMAMGTINVGTRVGVMAAPPVEVVDAGGRGGNSFLFDGPDKADHRDLEGAFREAFGRAFLLWSKDRGRWGSLRRRAIDVARGFTWDRLAPEYSALLELDERVGAAVSRGHAPRHRG